jgi:GTP 3',8-cyclase
MPEEDYVWLPKKELLTFEELAFLTSVFTEIGTQKIRLTGGEPLLRHDLPKLVELIACDSKVADLALTTNGILLPRYAKWLHEAGLTRITVSLDTLLPERFISITRRDALRDVHRGIEAAMEAGFAPLKLDTVLVRGLNDDEIAPLLRFARSIRAEIRFIEYMDVGGATRWSAEQVISRDEILERIGSTFGPVAALPKEDAAPADRFQLEDGTIFGVISSTTKPFCGTCDRARLTADGTFYLCLYARTGTDLRALVRGGASREEIAQVLRSTWAARTDRGAERRKELGDRGTLVQLGELRQDPRLEMHTRGG